MPKQSNEKSGELLLYAGLLLSLTNLLILLQQKLSQLFNRGFRTKNFPSSGDKTKNNKSAPDMKNKPPASNTKTDSEQQNKQQNNKNESPRMETKQKEKQNSTSHNKEKYEMEENKRLNSSKENSSTNHVQKRNDFAPALGEKVGLVKIPYIDMESGLFEGTNLEIMQKGFAHYSHSAWPSDHEQIILFGKYESVGYRIKECKVNHMITLSLPYGDFHYAISKIEKVRSELISITRYLGKEQLLIVMSDLEHPHYQYILLADPIHPN